ncbi:hypothetical protein ACQ3I4_12955 [Zafaria sp. Z1313]|uniref:hypothetical protein n=1 Tax=Zafaria sp. Z1313 TaxID=3423202 RepID=UPI003D302C72
MALVWLAGAAVAAGWAGCQLLGVRRRGAAVRTLLVAGATSESVEVGPRARASLSLARRRGLKTALLFTAGSAAGFAAARWILPGELGLTEAELGETTFSDVALAVGLGAGLLAVIWWAGCLARQVVVGGATGMVCQLPFAPGGPVVLDPSRETGMVPCEGGPDCSCAAELERWPDDAELFDELVPAAPYCPEHGIDVVNALRPDAFRRIAEQPWLWDGEATPPVPRDAGGTGPYVFAFAGELFAGIPVARTPSGVEAVTASTEEAEFLGEDEYRDRVPAVLRPQDGVLDRIDLRPAGFDGWAVRYRHGRAWFEQESS